MKVLLSVKPEFAEGILNGTKRFEFRKAIFRRPGVKTVVLYSTMPVGQVVGEFDIAEIHSAPPHHVWGLTSRHAGITLQFFSSYFRGRRTAYAIEVRRARRYRKPLALSSVCAGGNAPQSFRYL